MSTQKKFSTAKQNPNIPIVEDIEPSELRDKKSFVKIIDVRRPDEWAAELGHIEEASLMTLDTLPQRIGELDKNDTIVFVCRSGGRSAQATAFAKQNGFSNVYNMAGGMLAWNERNFEVSERNV